MKFVISYSGGKDSILSLHKMVEAGHTPLALLVMVNKEMGRSWFHGIDLTLLKLISESLEIPLLCCISDGEDYHSVIREGFVKAQNLGAEAIVFGDIDIEANRQWCETQCNAVGINAIFPLWQKQREEIIADIISLDYKCLIKCVQNALFDKNTLGMVLNAEVIEIMRDKKIDICGENGEYHTVVLDGPLFKHTIKYELKEKIDFGNISVINIIGLV